MKKSILTIVAAFSFAVLITGCSTTSTVITPATVQTATTLSVEGALIAEPKALPEVKIAGAVICAAAAGTNVSPAAVVADLQAAGLTNNTADTLIVNGVLLIYETAYNSLVNPADQASAQPYLQAVCNGINAAIPASVAKRALLKKLTVQDWSQLPIR
jgi:hypothetical protein